MRTVLILAAGSALLAQGATIEVRTKDGSGSVAAGLTVRVQHRATGAYQT